MFSGVVLELEESVTCLTCAYASKGTGTRTLGMCYCSELEQVVSVGDYCLSWSWASLGRPGRPVPVAVTSTTATKSTG